MSAPAKRRSRRAERGTWGERAARVRRRRRRLEGGPQAPRAHEPRVSAGQGHPGREAGIWLWVGGIKKSERRPSCVLFL